ncbi:MAG: hypothetical protein K6G60_03250 [Lachnospiraceae bacterium]|nr:hypothetical protein [Lachnospiraceae bacterium]
MYIKSINWLDESAKEAVLHVSNGEECIECFSCPCPYKIDETVGKLECLDEIDLHSTDSEDESIEKAEGAFRYRIRGKIKDLQSGFVEAKGFRFHVNENGIPKDLRNGMNVEFIATRIDLW